MEFKIVRFKDRPASTYFEVEEVDFKYYRDSYYGLCLYCGATRDTCEPDAREYECEECENNTVYGMEELLLMNRIHIVEGEED